MIFEIFLWNFLRVPPRLIFPLNDSLSNLYSSTPSPPFPLFHFQYFTSFIFYSSRNWAVRYCSSSPRSRFRRVLQFPDLCGCAYFATRSFPVWSRSFRSLGSRFAGRSDRSVVREWWLRGSVRARGDGDPVMFDFSAEKFFIVLAIRWPMKKPPRSEIRPKRVTFRRRYVTQ